MAETETGWTKEWPVAKDSFHWMRWTDGRYRDLPVHVNGIQVMCLFDHSYQQRGNVEGQVEFLGPIFPSDFEELTRLREAAAYSADVLDLAEAAMTAAAPYCARDLEIAIRERIVKVKNAITALREALAQHPTGEKL